MRWLFISCLAACGNPASPGARDLAVAATTDLAGGVDSGACGNSPQVNLTPVVSGLSKPTFAVGADSHQLFVTERRGRVRLAVDGTLRSTPFLDLSSGIASVGDDDGLLGLALHPMFASNGRVFVQYASTAHEAVVGEFARSAGNPEIATPTAIQTLLTVATSAGVRYGGMLAFAPDGTLYSGVGDGDTDGDPLKNAQNLSSPLGKILRFDVDNPATPPAGNLMGNVWDYGVREPWRFSFDRISGDLWIADVGHPQYQEIDIEPAGQGGKNYGWPVAAGKNHCLQSGCDVSTLTAPVAEYPKSAGCAIIGGYVYRGQALSCLSGLFVYTDYCSSNLHAMSKSGTSIDLAVNGNLQTVVSFGETADGELLVVDYDAGTVYQLD